jgi:hypothetical protein
MPGVVNNTASRGIEAARSIAETFSCVFSACASHIPIPRLLAQGFPANGMDIAKY